jgi:membrane-bound serine protease (ClpP class)
VRWRLLGSLAILALGAVLTLMPAGADPAAGGIESIPIHGTIDEGMAHLVDRAVHEAQERHARAILIDVDTFGGLVSAATEIRDSLINAGLPVYAFVSGRAWSAGALVTLSANHIALAPAASIGAAEPIPTTVKTISALRGEFSATATLRHRDPTLAAAMVDPKVDAPGYKAPGAILTLTADQAVRAHVADEVAPNQRAALANWHLDRLATIPAEYTFGEQIARFATDPNVSGILLSIGVLGLLIEMQTLHLVAGIIGVGALALFFGTHVYAGFSNGLVIGLAALGVLGILIELHVLPGHGVAGKLGLVALVAAVVLSFGFSFVFIAVQSLAIAIVVSVVLFTLLTRFFPQNAFMHRIAFLHEQGPDYVASLDHRTLVGHSGIATSYLRPAGVAAIDGQRVDVLTEGDFVQAGTAVVVTRVEGARIFVKPEVGP